MRPTSLIFVLPDDNHLVSGGNIYNRELIAAVREQRPVETISVAEWRRRMAQSSRGIYFIDTVNLQDFVRTATPSVSGQRLILVVHLLPSLVPDMPPDDAALAREAEALPRFDGYLVTSAYTAEHLAGRGLSGPRLIVPPGLPDQPRPPLPYRPEVRAVMVGNLLPGKAVVPFLHALAAEYRQDAPLTVELVGRGDLDADYARACRRAAQCLGDGVVQFRGPVPYAAMQDYYRQATVLVSASQMETFGMALQEARAWGLPILACTGGNVAAHVTHGRTGYLYDSPAALARGLVALAGDDDRRQRLFASSQALRQSDAYTWAGAAKTLLEQLAHTSFA